MKSRPALGRMSIVFDVDDLDSQTSLFSDSNNFGMYNLCEIKHIHEKENPGK